MSPFFAFFLYSFKPEIEPVHLTNAIYHVLEKTEINGVYNKHLKFSFQTNFFHLRSLKQNENDREKILV